jgi:hypothetical protein
MLASILGRSIGVIRKPSRHSHATLAALAHTSQSWTSPVETGDEMTTPEGASRIVCGLRVAVAGLRYEPAGWSF